MRFMVDTALRTGHGRCSGPAPDLFGPVVYCLCQLLVRRALWGRSGGARGPAHRGRLAWLGLALILMAAGWTTVRFSAPDKNRTCARGLGNRCSIH